MNRFLWLLIPLLWACNPSKKALAPVAEAPSPVQLTAPANPAAEQYNKLVVQIPMRDGVKLYTAIYTPKSASENNTYPMMLKRTPYSCRPYGPAAFPEKVGSSKAMMKEGYIFVYQDVRGRWMSEGDYDNMRPSNWGSKKCWKYR